MKSLRGLRIPTKKTDKLCPIHGIALVSSKYSPEPFCIKCTQEGIKAEDKQLHENFKHDQVLDLFFRRSLVEKRADFKNTFANYQAKKGSPEAMVGNQAYKIAQEYIAEPKKPLKTIMFGKPGAGKSHLAMGMLNKILEEGDPPQSCLFIDINSLFTENQRSFDDPICFWSKANAIKLLTHVDVLVLDDLGSESAMRQQVSEATEYKQQFLKEILGKQQRIIVTTNLTLEQLQRTYNSKNVSRLLSHSKGHRIDFQGIQDKRPLL